MVSKTQLQTDLNAARSASAQDDAEVLAVESRVRGTEVHEVEGIEELRPELEVLFLGKSKVLHHGRVKVLQIRSAKQVSSRIAGLQRLRARKSTGTKPTQASGIA